MIIDIKSKMAKKDDKSQEQADQQKVIDCLENMVELAKKGYIVGFASTGFTSEGRVFIAVERGLASTHEINSSISSLSNLFNGVVVSMEQVIIAELETPRDIFTLPKATLVE